jgi:ubiquitin C-terminal hydrolase
MNKAKDTSGKTVNSKKGSSQSSDNYSKNTGVNSRNPIKNNKQNNEKSETKNEKSALKKVLKEEKLQPKLEEKNQEKEKDNENANKKEENLEKKDKSQTQKNIINKTEKMDNYDYNNSSNTSKNNASNSNQSSSYNVSSNNNYERSHNSYNNSSYYYSGTYYSNDYYNNYSNHYYYKEKIKGIFGFSNNKMLNNCFMNSSLQNLLHCEKFCGLLHSISDNKLYNKPLSKEVKKLICQMYNGEDELDSTKVKTILSEVEEKYKYNSQNDANEFITIFLNKLLIELKDEGKYETSNIPSDDLEIKAFYKLEDKFFIKNKSLMLNLFYGRLKREYICQNGHIFSIKFNNYNTLILPQPTTSNKIVDLLKLYQEDKKINDTIFCKDCQHEVKYSIKTSIYDIPKYLILCLEKEMSYYSPGLDYPNKLYSKDFMANYNGDYALNSLIEYSGNRKSGHYIAKVCQDNKWYSISDRQYWEISKEEIHDRNAIILFYKRI